MLPTMLGVSLKTYFTHARTMEWLGTVAELLDHDEAVRQGQVEFFAAPTFPALEGTPSASSASMPSLHKTSPPPSRGRTRAK